MHNEYYLYQVPHCEWGQVLLLRNICSSLISICMDAGALHGSCPADGGQTVGAP